MKEKIEKIREKLIHELSKLETGIHIKLNYDDRILELIIFKDAKTNGLVIDNEGNHVNCKKFALPQEVINKIDFSNVSFETFVAYNYDFSNLYGVKLNPQTIFDKNLTNAILKGVTFIGSFNDVNIEGANFTGSTGAIINPKKLRKIKILNDLHDIRVCKCQFSDVEFIGTFDSGKGMLNINLWGANFTGSRGAKIYPSNYYLYNLSNCIFKDTTIIMPSKHGDQIRIDGANFTGARSQDIFGIKSNVKINPLQTDRNFKGTIFNGVDFIGPFNDTFINGADFTGSHNAIINLPKLRRNSGYNDTNFTDAFVYGHNHDKLIPTEDGRIFETIDSELNKLLNSEYENAILGQKELEEANINLIKGNREKVKKKINELVNLIKSSETLGVDPINLYCKVPIEQSLFLVKVADHYEINRDIIDLSLLRFLNLSEIDFTNVKVSGIDFRYSAARIDPQKVYGKDISHCIFDSGNIKFFDDLTGVNTEGANFDNCDFKPKKLKRT